MNMEKWLSDALNQIKSKKDYMSIHIDELDGYRDNGQKFLLDFSVETFQKSIHLLQSVDCTIQVELNIELTLESNNVIGVPRNHAELVSAVDVFGMPELFLSIPEKNYREVGIEDYSCPLPFQLFSGSENLQIIYREYRTLEELKSDELFTRWLELKYKVI